ncbi:conserved hypothetical protein [Carnobacterium maltaromaticum]|uniref:DUF4145 domain-containing protein n=1 Tax=Carnobacterium maltaromaticum TaxID=2751 RepID=UPI000704B3D6|nr:DUF4145 domain-containing protein [Carnobacterium maltaromaticum]KRN72387.1 hypothetical protein IV76_GL002614 [Carnobacterium maltaromaticum]CRH18073.1 conserved hypothetical protein [Carnobacterium maltaromaticum]
MVERDIKVYNEVSHSVGTQKAKIDEPKQCMHCKNTGKQELIALSLTGGEFDSEDVIALYICPLCCSTSIHFMANTSNNYDNKFYKSFETIPSVEIEPNKFNEIIRSKFPQFVEIYSQSEEAQNSNLNHLAGMGYRKALEFLVTDYLIEYPVDGVEEKWLTNPKVTLGNKIEKIQNNRIKKLSKAITYLGNDETHYSRQHPEYDIDSIKAFISVLISDIEHEMIFQDAEKLINKPKS